MNPEVEQSQNKKGNRISHVEKYASVLNDNDDALSDGVNLNFELKDVQYSRMTTTSLSENRRTVEIVSELRRNAIRPSQI